MLPTITPLGAVVQLATAALFFAAAYLCRAAWRRQHAVFDAWVAIGLLFAGFAELLWAQYPTGHPGQVSVADALRLAFFLALLFGVEAEAGGTMRRMRLANAELTRLRDVEVERAALEERRGSRASCTTGWRRTSGWRSFERASSRPWAISRRRPCAPWRRPSPRSTMGWRRHAAPSTR